jgi:hypothetical protein
MRNAYTGSKKITSSKNCHLPYLKNGWLDTRIGHDVPETLTVPVAHSDVLDEAQVNWGKGGRSF